MTTEKFITNLQEVLQPFAIGNLTKNSLELFSKLGYVTERFAPLNKPTFEEFKDKFIFDQGFDETKARVKEWKYVDLLFQLSREEVSQQASMFDTKQVNKTTIETYLFFTLELTGEEYNCTDLSNITREINHLFPMPVMVLFKYGKKLTFSVNNRRLHKRDESKRCIGESNYNKRYKHCRTHNSPFARALYTNQSSKKQKSHFLPTL